MIELRCPYCRNEFLHGVEKSCDTRCPACGGQMEIHKQIENMEVSKPFAPSYPELYWDTVSCYGIVTEAEKEVYREIRNGKYKTLKVETKEI